MAVASPKGSPLAPFFYCAAITVGLLIFGGVMFATRYSEMLAIETTAGRLTQLGGMILRLDETQTNSVRMAAATGDPHWEQRYREIDLPLDEAVRETFALAPSSGRAPALLAQLVDASLDAMDERAFAAVRRGDLAAAAAELGEHYEAQRKIYLDAMDTATRAIGREVGTSIARHRHSLIASIVIAATALACTTLLWLRMLARIRSYIRDRQAAEAELREAQLTLEDRVTARTAEVAASREQYRFLVENIDAIPFEWEPDTSRMRYVAPQLARLLACPPEALREADVIEHRLCPEDVERFRERIARFHAGDAPCTIDVRLITDAGQTITVRLTLGGRTPRGTAFGVILDITKQVKLESELQQSQKLESVGRLAAGIAHEINTPVQFITDNVQFIRSSLAELWPVLELHRGASQAVADQAAARAALAAEDDLDLPYLRDHMPAALEHALDGLSRVAAIVRSMKVFAHPDRQDRSLIDVNESLTSTLTIAHSEYKYVAELVTDLGTLPRVACYAGELNQVFLNLLVNASHAIGDVVARTGERGRITVSSRHDGDQVVIAIADSGTGIPLHIRDRVFDPFFTTKPVGRGTGQGLSHARSVIVDKHHGSLTFDTALGVGTTFYIRLPIEPAVTSLAA